jgi:anti-sigma-K factor RskA
MTDPTCSHSDDVAAYALGALPDVEAARMREHLATCRRCTAELAELQPVVDRLPAAVPAAIASPALKGRVMSVVNGEAELLRAAGPSADRPPAAEPRRRRFALPSLAGAGAVGLAAAAVIVAIVAIGSGGSTQRVTRGITRYQNASVVLRQSGAHAELDVANMPPPGANRIYQVWLEHGSEPPRPTDALFGVNRSGDASVAVPGDLHGVQHVLVTAEPLGGSPNGKPSEAPVMSVTVPA